MIIGHSIAATTCAVGVATALTDTSVLSDKRLAARCRMQWPSGAQTTSVYITLTATFPEQPIRVAALLGTDLPVGLKVEVAGRRAGDTQYDYDLRGNSTTATIGARAEGGTGVVWHFGAAREPVIGVRVRIYNAQYGFPAIPASSIIEIGEALVAPGEEVQVQADWQLGMQMPTQARRTIGAQPASVVRRSYRTLEATPDLVEGDPAGWSRLMYALGSDPYALAIVRHATEGDVQATSIFGQVTRVPTIKHAAGPLYQPGPLVVEEIPS